MTMFDLSAGLPSGTVVLEASAGTGKTHTIAALATRYLAEGVVRVDQLAVITFSRVASQELRSRVRQRLHDTATALDLVLGGVGLPPGADLADQVLAEGRRAEVEQRRARLGEAAANFDSATIVTIHEFCQAMMHSLGILAAEDPQGTFVDDLGRLEQEVAHDLYVARYAGNYNPPFSFSVASRLAQSAARTLDARLLPTAAQGRVRERVDFAVSVRSGLAERKRRLGVYSFDDQLLRLRDSLRDGAGEAACQRLRSMLHVVLVDEFQDTDPVQWEILRLAFHGERTLVLIGDPKQAIYTFRGADVGAYQQAVAQASGKLSLGVNHRADEPVVDALDALFGGAILGFGIDVPTVRAAHTTSRLTVPAGSPWRTPVRIRTVAHGHTVKVDQARRLITDDLVQEVGMLLSPGAATLSVGGRGRPLQAGDIAVLVRSNKRGREVARALAAAGRQVAFSGADSILASEAAEEWLTLLRALDQPRRSLVRAAVLTDFVGASLTDLATAEEDRHADWAALIHRWARIHRSDGVAALFAAIQAEGSFTERVLAGHRGDRALTDYRHVAQLLHEQASGGVSGAALVDWLAQAIKADEGVGERTRRLETDADAVQVMTVHKAKGLQFPVVLLPEAADLYTREDEGQELVFHDETGARVLDLGGLEAPGRSERFAIHQAEQSADSLRTLYVAATRAQSQLTMWWARTPYNTASSPLHRMLFRRRDRPGTPDLSYPIDQPPGDGDPSGLSWLAGSGITVEVVAGAGSSAGPMTARPVNDLAAAAWSREIDRHWRRTSYSGLTAAAHAHALPSNPSATGVTEDEPGPDAATAPSAPPGHPSPMAGLPGGTTFGTLVHSVLETLDWHAPLPSDEPALGARLREAAATALARFPVPGVDADALSASLLPTLLTPLGALADGSCLADIPVTDRLTELDFEFALGAETSRTTVGEIADLLGRHLLADDPLAGYPSLLRDPVLAGQVLRGFLTGSIDAVLRVGDGTARRFVVIDYKTNRLSDAPDLSLTHYTDDAMAREMLRAHYPLQAILYAVALHRFLAHRLPDYQPEIHLGGVGYLFVRGMGGRPAHPAAGTTGVFAWNPPSRLVVALSSLLAGRSA